MPNLYDCGIALIEYETPLNEYSSLRAECLIIVVKNRICSGNSLIRDKRKAKCLFALMGRNSLRIFFIISGSASQKYF